MKKILLIAILIYSGLANAQTWCPPGAEWYYGYGGMFITGYQKLTYEKDTVVLSQPCKKLIGSLVSRYQFHNYIDTIPINPIYTYSQGDTVYTFINGMFRAVYFFNAQVGDTLSSYNFDLPGNGFLCIDTVLKQVVDTTGTMVINSDTLRFYVARNIDFVESYLEPLKVKVVERFGAIDNYFVPYFVCIFDVDGYAFRCYSDDSFPTYQAYPSIPCDYIYLSLQDIENSPISISPNPATNTISVSGSLKESIETINIYNIVGQLQKRMTKEGGKTISTIDVSDFQDGIYLLQIISSSGQTIMTKFIKQTH